MEFYQCAKLCMVFEIRELKLKKKKKKNNNNNNKENKEMKNSDFFTILTTFTLSDFGHFLRTPIF